MGRRGRRRQVTDPPGWPAPVDLTGVAGLVQEADGQALALHRELDARLFSERRSGMTVTALSAATGFSRTTVHKALNRAADRGEPTEPHGY